MPFHTMMLTTYECRLKKFVYQPEIILHSQLVSAFKNDPLWSEPLNDTTSTLSIFLDAYFKVGENKVNYEAEYDL